MFFFVWLLSVLVVVMVVFVVKSLRRGRLARLMDFHWPGLIVISLIVGAVPAFIYDNQSSRTVEVPDGVAERPNIPNVAKE
jgi:glucan phosphoethanolaminetransferase (alkaline phosphatase superfamily)